MGGRSIFDWLGLRGTARSASNTVAPRPVGFAETLETVLPAGSPERREQVLATTAQRIENAMLADRRGPREGLPFPGNGPEGHRHRMRTKLVERGADALADYELLEMLLFFVQPKGDTKPLAKTLINRFGSFAAVLTAPTSKLLEAPGIGLHSVAAIRLVQAAATRLARAQIADQPVFNNQDRLSEYLRVVMGREPIEQFRVLFLNSCNRLLADEVQGRGTVNAAPVYPREVVRRALELHATAMILVHNHPSGNALASLDDIEMTRAVVQAASALGVVVHDHIIVGREHDFSFRREGFL